MDEPQAHAQPLIDAVEDARRPFGEEGVRGEGETRAPADPVLGDEASRSASPAAQSSRLARAAKADERSFPRKLLEYMQRKYREFPEILRSQIEKFWEQREILSAWDQAAKDKVSRMVIYFQSLSFDEQTRKNIKGEPAYDARALMYAVERDPGLDVVYVTKMKVSQAVKDHLFGHLSAAERERCLSQVTFISVEESGRLPALSDNRNDYKWWNQLVIEQLELWEQDSAHRPEWPGGLEEPVKAALSAEYEKRRATETPEARLQAKSKAAQSAQRERRATKETLAARLNAKFKELGDRLPEKDLSLADMVMLPENRAVREAIAKAAEAAQAVRAQARAAVEPGAADRGYPVKVVPFIAQKSEWGLIADLRDSFGLRTTLDGPLEVDILDNKSVQREIFREIISQHPELNMHMADGFEHIYDLTDLARKGAALWHRHPKLKRLMVKLNNGVSGLGNVAVFLQGGEASKSLTEQERYELILRTLQRMKKSPVGKAYFRQMKEFGAVVEEFLDWIPVSPAPSTQLRVQVNGKVLVHTTHDQDLDHGVFIGGRQPANDAYRADMMRGDRVIAQTLWRDYGLVGFMGVDNAARRGKTGNRWRMYKVEVNPRAGGFTHSARAVMVMTGARPDGEGRLVLEDGTPVYSHSTDHAIIAGLIGLDEQELEEFLRFMGPYQKLHLILGLGWKANMGATAHTVASRQAATEGLGRLIKRAWVRALDRTLRRSGYPPLKLRDRPAADKPKVAILGAPTPRNLALLAEACTLFPGDFLLVDRRDFVKKDQFVSAGLSYNSKTGEYVLATYKRKPQAVAHVFDVTRPTVDQLTVRTLALAGAVDENEVKVPDTLAFLNERHPLLRKNFAPAVKKRVQRKIRLAPFNRDQVQRTLSRWLTDHREDIGNRIVVHTSLGKKPQEFVAEQFKGARAGAEDQRREGDDEDQPQNEEDEPRIFTPDQGAQIADYVLELQRKLGKKGAVVVESSAEPLFMKFEAVRVPGKGVQFGFDKRLYKSDRDDEDYALQMKEQTEEDSNWDYWFKLYGLDDAATLYKLPGIKEKKTRYERLKEDVKALISAVFRSMPGQDYLVLRIGFWPGYTDEEDGESRPLRLRPVLLGVQGSEDPSETRQIDEMKGDLRAQREREVGALLRDGTPVLRARAKSMEARAMGRDSRQVRISRQRLQTLVERVGETDRPAALRQLLRLLGDAESAPRSP
ncbi:MAG: hypothetical protein HY552_04210 [Elusimicrobia bacterium]|nr:hypothetical protein [Elusimicrobiota bacterium]